MSYMYLKVGMTHFYRLALCNLVLGLTDIFWKMASTISFACLVFNAVVIM